MKVVSPGKIMIAGEYSVLSGQPALVKAINRYASCRFEAHTTTRFFSKTSADFIEECSTLVDAVQTVCQEQHIEIPTGHYFLDSSAFFEKGKKIGLGSSAAVITAFIKTILAQHGDVQVEKLFLLSDKSHRLFNGGVGSGADIATAVYGGLLIYQRDPLLMQRLPCSFDDLLVISTGKPQKSSAFVKKFLENQSSFKDIFAKESSKIISTIIAQHHDEHCMVNAFEQLANLLDELGQTIGCDIVSKEHRAIMNIAASCGGTAKPSGAGGGDIAIAVVPKERRDEFCTILAQSCYKLVSV